MDLVVSKSLANEFVVLYNLACPSVLNDSRRSAQFSDRLDKCRRCGMKDIEFFLCGRARRTRNQ
jgi:hypothetical protein